jgi:3-isopropylmalate dehydrogenase
MCYYSNIIYFGRKVFSYGKGCAIMNYNIAVIPGDGIGPEIIAEAKKVLEKIGEVFGHQFHFTEVLMGGVSIDTHGVPLTEEAIATAKASDSVLLGAVGGNVGQSNWYSLPPNLRPEAGLLALRKNLELYANIRPAILFEELKAACPLKDEIIGDGFDFVVMRELTGGLYFGERGTTTEAGVRKAFDSLVYDEHEIRRVAIWAFEIAMKRNKRVCSVDKANVLDSSRLWRQVVKEVAAGYPEIELSDMLVDNCAMQLVKDPKQFDVILTENMFGDILSDEASMVTGSIGMLSSASLGKTKLGLYEPSHGSAPDIAGQNKANPIATILSAAMMLRYSFDLLEEADRIETAVKEVLKKGYRTMDIMSEGKILVGTKEMGEYILAEI